VTCYCSGPYLEDGRVNTGHLSNKADVSLNHLQQKGTRQFMNLEEAALGGVAQACRRADADADVPSVAKSVQRCANRLLNVSYQAITVHPLLFVFPFNAAVHDMSSVHFIWYLDTSRLGEPGYHRTCPLTLTYLAGLQQVPILATEPKR
jgi:hypothetical protein